jgi:hypothetical protein
MAPLIITGEIMAAAARVPDFLRKSFRVMDLLVFLEQVFDDF